MSSCCTPTENSQFHGRTPHPFMIAGSNEVAGLRLPNVGVSHTPHSPLAALSVSTQSGTQLLVRGSPAPNMLSFQVRAGELTRVVAGLLAAAVPIESCCTPRLALALSAVLPLPNRSKAIDTRGLISFQFGTFSPAGRVMLRV